MEYGETTAEIWRKKIGLLLVTMLRSIVISKTLGSRHNTCSSHWINSVFMTWWKKNTVSSNQFKTFAEICVFVISVLVACLSIGGGNKAASYFHHQITANVIFVSTIRFKRYKMLWILMKGKKMKAFKLPLT